MKLTMKKHSVDTIFILILLCLFSVLSLLLLLIGANTYKQMIEKIEANNQLRASVSYVSNKIRSADRLSIQTQAGTDVIVIDEGEYCTYIYHYQNHLMELYTAKSDPFVPNNGEKIVPIERFTFSQTSGSMIELAAQIQGKPPVHLKLNLRTSLRT